MAQPPMTCRPQYDNDEAPPPYEASPSTNTGSAANSAAVPIVAHQHHQQYPVLASNPNPDQYANDGTTPASPPPPTSYYPDVNAAPLYPQYPVLTLSAPHSPLYTVATSAAPPPHPQAYPSMPFQTLNGSVLRSYPAMQGLQSQQRQPSAPPVPATSAWVDVPSAGTPLSQSFAPQVQEYNVIGLDDWPYQSVATTAPAMGSPPLSGPILSPALPAPISSTASVPASPLPSQSAPPIELPELVTIYKCRKCGATLESETAVCRRIHTLTVKPAEWQAREATGADLEERRQYQERPGQLSLSLTSSSSTSAPSDGSTFASPTSFTQAPVPAPHPAPISSPLPSPLPVPSLVPAHIPVASPKNNHGTNDIYLRRSISVQNPVTTLKKFWRDAKGEFKHRQSASTQYEFVSPPPLQPQPHLAASTHSPHPPPLPTPSPHTYSHAPPQAIPAEPPVQPWLAPSSAPPRSQFWG